VIFQGANGGSIVVQIPVEPISVTAFSAPSVTPDR